MSFSNIYKMILTLQQTYKCITLQIQISISHAPRKLFYYFDFLKWLFLTLKKEKIIVPSLYPSTF